MKVIDNKKESETLLYCFEQQDDDLKEICILVGYCCYSAFTEIVKSEKAREFFLKTNVKIIIGMEIDSYTQHLYIKYNNKENNENLEKSKEHFLNYTIEQKNNNYEHIKVLELFKEKCLNNTLEIRKSNEQTHAKLYLFKYNRNSIKGSYVLGSSNFSRSGLVGRREINIYAKDDFEKFDNFFEEEWQNSTAILNIQNHETFFKEVGIETETKNIDEKYETIKTNNITPHKIFLKVIYEYFNYFDKEELIYTPNHFNFRNYKYQIDAIKSAVKSIITYNGVLVSDVVGLGKSIMASTVAKNLLEMKIVEEVIIISPPKIIYSWENYASEFKINGKVCSIGKLEDTLAYIKNHKKSRLIIIDEAHRFVNNKTSSYNLIIDICSTNKVMLLTATPMHNTTSDIFSLIDIFDKILLNNQNMNEIKNKILKEEKILKSQYKENDSKEDTKDKIKIISKEILSLINPIIIRRTRKDLIENLEYKKDLEDQNTEFNNVEDPQLHDYKLGDISSLYLKTLEKITPYDDENNEKDLFNNNNIDSENNNNKFKAVRYEPLSYLKNTTIDEKKKNDDIIKKIYGEDINADFASASSRNLTKFMRHLLIRRFESSVYAFKMSINNMIDKYDNIKNWINKGKYPIYKKDGMLYIEDLFTYNENNEDDDNAVLDYKKIEENKKYNNLTIIEDVHNVLDEQFFKDFDNDLKILNEIKNDWENINVDEDRKFKKLIEKLKKFKKENEKRKIIIFTEFKDTADYLYESIYKNDELKNLLKPIKSTSESNNRESIIKNFDASISEEKQEDYYFLLISTDTLSEGINLHRAGIVINYDIPYNPTRVIQRVGRINRIGKKLFDKIYIHNFIPRLEAQNDIKNWQISNFKLTLINAIFGNDTKVLQKDDELNSLFCLKNDNNILENDDTSWDNEYRNIYNKLKNDEELLKEINDIGNNITIRRKSNFEGLLEIVHSNNGVFGALLKNSRVDYNIENIFKILKANENEKSFEVSEKIEYLESELKRRKNIKNNKKQSDTSLILKKFSETINDDKEKEYIKKLIFIIDSKSISNNKIKEIEKCLKEKKGCGVQEIQKIYSSSEAETQYIYLNNSNNLENIYKNSYLIVKEEFSNQ